MRGYHCSECGEIYYASRQKRNHLCHTCGRRRSDIVIKQLQDQEGIYYERWKKKFGEWKAAVSCKEGPYYQRVLAGIERRKHARNQAT